MLSMQKRIWPICMTFLWCCPIMPAYSFSNLAAFSKISVAVRLGGMGAARASLLRPASTKSNVECSDAPGVVSALHPQSLWRNFEALSNIPRPSKQEGQVLDMLKRFATDRGLDYKQDSIGNVVIYRKGSGGGEFAPPVLIQGHVDMVCEKNAENDHDFNKDPIVLVRDGDWVRADGTTLGADNGIGVAAAMSLLELPATAKLPPLECLFTVDEETGLTGAYALDASMVRISRRPQR